MSDDARVQVALWKVVRAAEHLIFEPRMYAPGSKKAVLRDALRDLKNLIAEISRPPEQIQNQESKEAVLEPGPQEVVNPETKEDPPEPLPPAEVPYHGDKEAIQEPRGELAELLEHREPPPL